MPFHSVELQLSLASMQVALRLVRTRLGPEVSVILKRALKESEAIALSTRALVERIVFNASGHWTLTVCDAQRRLSAMPLLKLRPCGMESLWIES